MISRIGMTQVQLANILGVSDRTVRHWQRGRYRPVKGIVILLKILGAKRN